VINTATAAVAPIRATATLEDTAATVSNRTAIATPYCIASEWATAGFDADAVCTGFTDITGATVEGMPTAVTHAAAKLRCSGLARARHLAARSTDTKVIDACPAGLITIAAIDGATAAVANLAAILTPGWTTGYCPGTGLTSITQGSGCIGLHIE
jgi:hypothetical protein